MVSLKVVFISLFFLIKANGFSQLLLNGDFSLGNLSWVCNPEVAAQSSYGGSGGNLVAEVDAGAGLCQLVAGFIPGNTYYIAIDASRRTGGCPSPPVTNMDLVVVGALSVTITRTNTVFGLTPSAFLFTATSIAHTIIFSPGSGFGGSTCGMIVDNVITAGSALPVELINFSGEIKNNQAQLYWSTATEKNNQYFEIERSENGIDFNIISHLVSKAKNGNSSTRLNYEALDRSPFSGTNYYRIKQVDYDGTSSLSPLIAITNEKEQTTPLIYPNPGNGKFNISLPGLKKSQDILISIYDQLGKLKYASVFKADHSTVFEVNPDNPLEPGYYNFCITVRDVKTYKKVLVQ